MTRPRATLLGAILAGGRARRFGGDKAAALLAGKPLLDHVAEALAAACGAVVVVGRAWPGLPAITDAPGPDLGPLGGLLGALRHAHAHGFEAVLSAGCDTPLLPADMVGLLDPGPALIVDQPTLGLWPVTLAPALEAHIARDAKRSLRGWAEAAGARWVALPQPIPNINTRAQLAALRPPEDPRSSR